MIGTCFTHNIFKWNGNKLKVIYYIYKVQRASEIHILNFISNI